jgi:hypothetical protein
MATAAQIEANRRNSQKSCGARTQAGKDKSRFNALDHGCRANILVLPTEEFLLDQGMPWLAPDKLKAVRLLGRHPIDA